MENYIIKPEWIPSGYLNAEKKRLSKPEELTEKTGVFQTDEKASVKVRRMTKIGLSRKQK